MKKFLVKLLLIVLAVSLLCSVCAVLNGCDNKSNGKDPTDNTDDTGNNEQENGPSSDSAKKFSGSFTILCANEGKEFWRVNDNGTELDKAVYLRNQEFSKLTGMDVIPLSMSASEISDYVSNAIKSDSDSSKFDIVNVIPIVASKIVLADNALNFYDFEDINLENPWWDQNARQNLTINSKAYMMVGDFNTSTVSNIPCLLYNKNLCRELGVEDIESLVISQKWTMDKLISCISKLSDNPDDTYRRHYALASSSPSPLQYCFVYGFGEKTFTYNNASKTLEYSFTNNDINSKVGKVFELYRKDKVDSSTSYHSFAMGTSLFCTATIGDIELCTQGLDKDAWGICPLPKYNDQQESYITSVYQSHTVTVLPKNVSSRMERTGVGIEALNSLSHKDLLSAVYNDATASKYSSDEYTKKTLDLMLAGRTYDVGVISSLPSNAFISYVSELCTSPTKTEDVGHTIGVRYSYNAKTDALAEFEKFNSVYGVAVTGFFKD